jgi:hypothetical protein
MATESLEEILGLWLVFNFSTFPLKSVPNLPYIWLVFVSSFPEFDSLTYVSLFGQICVAMVTGRCI